jgi:DNA-binding CsgD family transcriptional regulator
MVEILRSGDVQRLQTAFAHTRDESFFSHFRNLLRARLRFDTLLILRFSDSGVPQALDTWLADLGLQSKYPRNYLEGAYRLDPFFQVRKSVSPGGMFRLSEIAPDRFFSGEYYLQYYQKTKIRDEVGLLVDLKGGATGHLSFSRQAGNGRFKRRELQCLQHFSPLLLELLRQYCEFRQDQQGEGTPSPNLRPLESVIQDHVKDLCGTSLTRRETQIIALILQGHSNLSAALALGIARQTAKVHRRNIYRKLMISSQAELFAMLNDLF